MKRGLFCTLLLMLLLVCLSVLPTEAQAAGAENLIFVANSNASYCLTRCDVSATGELEIPATHNGYPITQIGESAFSACTGLTAIVIPEGIKDIGVGAFSGCTNLTDISIPNSVTAIGNYAFDGCTNLNYNTYGNANYLGNDSNPYALLTSAVSADITTCQIHEDTRAIGFGAFSGCVNLTEITIPDGVTGIGNAVFDGCVGLQRIDLGKGLVAIGESAFRGCAGLTEITFPHGVTDIGMDAFRGCAGLTEITLPNGITDIGWHAFSNCVGLTEITIPGSVTSLGEYAFDGCTGLEKVFFEGTCAAWKEISPHGALSDSVTVVTTAHSYAGVVTKEATCVSEGVMSYVCSCGDAKAETDPIPLTTHSYGQWTEVKAPTIEETGTEERICIHCDEKQQREIAKLEVIPTEPTEPSVAPNPTKPTIGAGKEKNGNFVGWIVAIAAVGVLAVGVTIALKKNNTRK